MDRSLIQCSRTLHLQVIVPNWFELYCRTTLSDRTDPERYVIQLDGTDVWQYVVDADMWGLVSGNNQLVFDIGSTTVVTAGTVKWYNRYLGQ